MAQISLTLGETGENIIIDNDIATESTLNKLAKQLETMPDLSPQLKMGFVEVAKQAGMDAEKIAEAIGSKDNPEVVQAIEEQTEDNEESQRKTRNVLEKVGNEASRQRKKQTEEEQKSKKLASFFQKKMGDNFSFFGSILQKLVTGLFAVGVTGVGVFFSSIQNLGNGLKNLTDVGGAFGDVLKDGSVTTTDNIVALNQLGLTTDQAVTLLANFSQSAAVLGQSALPQLNQQFLKLTGFGSELGVALDDATQFFQEDLAFRTSILLRDRINQFETARASEQGIKNLRMFSTLLGRSADDLRNESRAIIDNDKAFQQLLVSLGPLGENVVNATDSLFQGLKAANIPDEILGGILQVATIGSEAASDFINALGPFAPELRDELTGLGMAIRNGTITMDQVQGRVLGVLNSVETADTGQLKQLVAALDNDLKGAAEALIGFSVDASNARENFQMGEVAGRFSDIQKAMTNFENVLKLGQGALSTFKNSLVLGAESGLSQFADALGSASDANSRLSQIAKRVGETLGSIFNKFVRRIFGGDFINNFDATLDSIVAGLNKFGDKLIDFVDDVMEGFFDSKGQFNLIDGLSNYLTTALGAALEILMTALVIAIPKFFGALFTNFDVVIGLVTAFGALLLGTAVITGLQTAFMAMWMGLSPLMLKAWNMLMAKMGFTGGGRGGIFGGAGKMSSKLKTGLKVGGAVVAGGMVAKDAFDVVAGTDGGASGKNIGGTIGGVIGMLGFLAGPLGGAIGMAAGNFIGNKIGGIFDKKDKKDEKRDQKIAVAEQQQQNQSVASVRIAQRSGLSLSFLDKATDPNATGDPADMTVSERRDVDEMSNEAKLLTMLLAENKSQTKKLEDISNLRS
mgnify:CR=1 FL=1